MKKTPKTQENHDRHEKLAVAAFILTLLIALGAFYFIWTTNSSFGLSIGGTKNFACLQMCKDSESAKQHDACIADCMSVVEVKTTSVEPCCCKLTAGHSKFDKYVRWIETPNNEVDTQARCEGACTTISPSTGDPVSTLANVGKCKFIE